MRKEKWCSNHWSEQAWLPCSDVPPRAPDPQPKVGIVELVKVSEAYSKRRQEEGGWPNHSSKPTWPSHDDDNEAPPSNWSPQPKKFGTWEPTEMRGATYAQRKTKEVQELKRAQLESVKDPNPAKVKRDCDTDSDVSEISEDVQLLLGGHDETSAWRWAKEDGGWSRAPGGLESRSMVRLSDVQALPRDSTGVPLSFGSLGHVLHTEKCKVCVFHRRNRCRHHWLCTFCHADHQPFVRARRPQKHRKHESVNSMNVNSDSQIVVCSGSILAQLLSRMTLHRCCTLLRGLTHVSR